MIYSFFFLFICVGQLWAQTSYVAPTTILNKKGYQIGVSGDYFKSTKSIDKDGTKIDFGNGESFNRIQSDVFGHYGLTNNFQIGGGVRMRRNSSTLLNASNEPVKDTSTGVQSTYLNFIYAFKPVDRLRYILEGQFRFTPYTNEEVTGTNTGKLVLGDDGNEYSAGFGVSYSSLSSNFVTVRGGYRKPGKEISPELYWQVEGALQWKRVALIAGVDGVISMNQDPYDDNQAARPNFNTGRTALYHSLNREFIAPYAGINFALNPQWRVEFRGSQVVSGRSTDMGTSFGASLIRRVEGVKSDRPDQKFKNYDFEATVTKISSKKGYLVIDKGLADDVQKGLKIDFYYFDYVGGNILLARGIVLQAKATTSIVKITQTYNTKNELKEGTIARGSFK